MKLVLAIDGGGVRGLIPALILQEVMQRAVAAGLAAEPWRHFDLMAGTSTGGIIVAGLACPHPKGPHPDGSPRASCTPAELVQLYQVDSKLIFKAERFRWLRESLRQWSITALDEERYSHVPIEKALHDRLGDAPLSRALTTVMLTAYDIELRETRFMASHPGGDDYRFCDAARASSAAPVYFEPARIENIGRTRWETLVDGGVFVNDPALAAYVEARKCFPDERDIRVVSLGTGTATRSYRYDDAKDWGAIGWANPGNALPILSVMMHGQAHATQYHMRRLLPDGHYIRLNSPLTEAQDDLDDATDENLGELSAVARRISAAQGEKIERIVRIMTERQAQAGS